ncbi:MAG: HNH endonuclease [Actinomycetaceae bacterium]|nr:HNH endonuclease [Actinomycetaceae bacterium]
MESLMRDLGWDPDVVAKCSSQYEEWEARARLSTQLVSDEAERRKMLVMAMRHIARHRGWRSPWQRSESLLGVQEESESFELLRQIVEERVGKKVAAGATVGQLVWLLELSERVNLRRTGNTKKPKSPTLPLRMMQSDHAHEVQVIAERQGLGEDVARRLILTIFDMKSPRKAATKRAGDDPLPGQKDKRRAQRAHPDFQRFRIISTVMNLRIVDENGEISPIGEQQVLDVVDLLSTWKGKDRPTWSDVAKRLNVPRQRLHGAGVLTDVGELVSGLPPIDTTEALMRSCPIKKVRTWWKNATHEYKCSFINALTGNEEEEEDSYADVIEQFLATLSDEELAKLDNLKFPAGRAAYSADSLRRLNEYMLENVCDLSEARMGEFGVDKTWRPPADPIHTPTGNPAVDRVLKAVNRWLLMVEYRWGTPESVNIEHVRSGFTSERLSREYQRDTNRHAEANEKAKKLLEEAEGKQNARLFDVRRYQALQRQNGTCLYCDSAITFTSCQMDHIIPRKGVGSSNVRANLVAVCTECNKEKSNIPFAKWAAESARSGVSVEEAVGRLEFWTADPGMSQKEFRDLKRDIAARLTRTDNDPEFDGRSMESVAWMARELAHRIEAHFHADGEGCQVRVYRGALTAEARKAGGFEKQVRMIGGTGKTRLDRRHHAIDAAVIALMRPSVAHTLGSRRELRVSQRNTNQPETWREYEGRTIADKAIFQKWRQHMRILADLCQTAIDQDEIPVHRNLRLGLSRGEAHDAQPTAVNNKCIGESWTMDEIDRVSSPAAWCALTREPDFEWKKGLPANDSRNILVNGREYSGSDLIPIFNSSKAQIHVRGGAVGVGDAIHHVRLYRVTKGKKSSVFMLRVFAHDLLRFRDKDLFAVELPPQSLSHRYAAPKLRDALWEGNAEYMGWLVKSDELKIDLKEKLGGDIGAYFDVFPETKSWSITGFESNSIINLKPTLISQEGLNDDISTKSVVTVVAGKGWRATVNTLFSKHAVTVIRRNALGEERWRASGRLPISWEVNS